jgi:hypothetical protein
MLSTGIEPVSLTWKASVLKTTELREQSFDEDSKFPHCESNTGHQRHKLGFYH